MLFAPLSCTADAMQSLTIRPVKAEKLFARGSKGLKNLKKSPKSKPK